jgi:hypothetical protein
VLSAFVLFAVWVLARASARSDTALDAVRREQDERKEADKIRRDLEREPDPVEKLRDKWSRD